MQFIDEVKIYISSGPGGNGCMSFRREANVPKGGPDGGNGGRGGSVIARCVPGLNTLIDYRYTQHFRAKKGEHGKGSNRDGKAAADVILEVPVGTQIFLEDKETLLADLVKVGQEVVLAEGGTGGIGNTAFKSSINRAPRKTIPGGEGEERWLWFQLKLLSDAGLVGLPNAGKSTFLSAVTRAKPKIADYPFTTLKPQLGVVYVDKKEFVLADLPGLIEGAHEGQGLGDRFLRHIERCGVILHLVDATEQDVAENYRIIRNELKQYNPRLAEKKEVAALTKCDAVAPEAMRKKEKALMKISGAKPYVISAVSGEGMQQALRALLKKVETMRSAD